LAEPLNDHIAVLPPADGTTPEQKRVRSRLPAA